MLKKTKTKYRLQTEKNTTNSKNNRRPLSSRVWKETSTKNSQRFKRTLGWFLIPRITRVFQQSKKHLE